MPGQVSSKTLDSFLANNIFLKEMMRVLNFKGFLIYAMSTKDSLLLHILGNETKDLVVNKFSKGLDYAEY